MITLLIATRNRHKAEEIRAILGEGFRCLTLNDFPDAPEVVEDANTFAGNATKKAVELARWLSRIQGPRFELQGSRFFVVADDSGLEVDALGGSPGVRSARFAAASTGRAGEGRAENTSDAANNAKLLRLLEGVSPEKRAARFRCVLALTPVIEPRAEGASPVCSANELELQTELFECVCDGRIGFEPKGQGGFGYDPLFVPDGYDRTFAELGEEIKNRLSHRAKALAKLKAKLGAEQGNHG